MTASSLVLGPILRHVDETSASIWVETRAAAIIVVRAGERAWRAPTFAVHGHHYALVEVDGLEPGSVTAYTVEVDGEPVWPVPGSPYPPSVMATLAAGRPLRLAYGSCRTSVPHDAAGNRTHGVDSLRAFALRLAERPQPPRPDLLLLLGDQVYADSTTKQMREFIRGRRDLGEPPGRELKDYEEYAHLYSLAWADDANRWLLSTLPTAMMFDDHDIRDDWNASLSWKRRMEAKPWWRGRIVAGLGAYWVYQHLGNLSSAERAADPLWQRIRAHTGEGELDVSAELDAFADRCDREPTTYRWSYSRDVGDVRLVVVDTRVARELDPNARGILNREEQRWLDDRMRGGVRHLLVATSLPFLLPMGLHHLEAWDEALAQGAWGRAMGRVGEKLRQAVDLEHWAAFQNSFQAVAALATEVADGRRGRAPETIAFLGGDVHYSYVSEVDREAGSRIVQAVCSPIRNPLPRWLRWFAVATSYGVAVPFGAAAARSAKVPDPPFRWHELKGPWFDNNLATLDVLPNGLRLAWHTGVVEGGDQEHPRLRQVAGLAVTARRSAEWVDAGLPGDPTREGTGSVPEMGFGPAEDVPSARVQAWPGARAKRTG